MIPLIILKKGFEIRMKITQRKYCRVLKNIAKTDIGRR